MPRVRPSFGLSLFHTALAQVDALERHSDTDDHDASGSNESCDGRKIDSGENVSHFDSPYLMQGCALPALSDMLKIMLS
jgi:hypothetical protein